MTDQQIIWKSVYTVLMVVFNYRTAIQLARLVIRRDYRRVSGKVDMANFWNGMGFDEVHYSDSIRKEWERSSRPYRISIVPLLFGVLLYGVIIVCLIYQWI